MYHICGDTRRPRASMEAEDLPRQFLILNVKSEVLCSPIIFEIPLCFPVILFQPPDHSR